MPSASFEHITSSLDISIFTIIAVSMIFRHYNRCYWASWNAKCLYLRHIIDSAIFISTTSRRLFALYIFAMPFSAWDRPSISFLCIAIFAKSAPDYVVAAQELLVDDMVICGLLKRYWRFSIFVSHGQSALATESRQADRYEGHDSLAFLSLHDTELIFTLQVISPSRRVDDIYANAAFCCHYRWYGRRENTRHHCRATLSWDIEWIYRYQ